MKWRGDWLSRQEQNIEEEAKEVMGPVTAWFHSLWQQLQYIVLCLAAIIVAVFTAYICIRCQLYKICKICRRKKNIRDTEHTSRTYQNAGTVDETAPIIRQQPPANPSAPRTSDLNAACNDNWTQAAQLHQPTGAGTFTLAQQREMAPVPTNRTVSQTTLTPY